MIRETLRTLNLTGWLIVTVLILTLVLMGWCSLDAGRAKRDDINAARAGQVVTEASQSTAIVASKASETAAEAARASQASRIETMLKSSPRPALTLLSALSLALACASCANAPPMPTILAAVQCGPLVPDSLRRDVPPADLPANDTAGAWVAFADAQTGRLEIANANKTAVVQIVDACDRQQAAIREALKPKPWWRFWG